MPHIPIRIGLHRHNVYILQNMTWILLYYNSIWLYKVNQYECAQYPSNKKRGDAEEGPRQSPRVSQGGSLYSFAHEHPLVAPQVLHFMHVPLRTRVKFPHSPHGSPS